jgi:hypothetical protein
MNFTTFVRKPFVVEAVEVTEENIAEISKFVGTLRHKEDGTPYINVDRRLFPNIYRVYPGFWMTQMGDNIRCYSKQVFKKQFMRSNDDIEMLCKAMNNHHHNIEDTFDDDDDDDGDDEGDDLEIVEEGNRGDT